MVSSEQLFWCAGRTLRELSDRNSSLGAFGPPTKHEKFVGRASRPHSKFAQARRPRHQSKTFGTCWQETILWWAAATS
jgi:hypothetical protein